MKGEMGWTRVVSCYIHCKWTLTLLLFLLTFKPVRWRVKRMFRWKELLDPHEQLQMPGKQRPKAEKQRCSEQSRECGRSRSWPMIVGKTPSRYRLHSRCHPSRTSVSSMAETLAVYRALLLHTADLGAALSRDETITMSSVCGPGRLVQMRASACTALRAT